MSSSAQQPTQPAFRVRCELAIADLVAADRAVTNVADLQPSEITVLQNRKPQKIEFRAARSTRSG